MSGRDGTRRTLVAFGVMLAVMALVSGPAGAAPEADLGGGPGSGTGGGVPVAVPLPPPVPAPVRATGRSAHCPGD